MKKLLSLKTLLICISFTVFLLLVKDNMNVVWSAIGWITGIITPFAIGFLLLTSLTIRTNFSTPKFSAEWGESENSLLTSENPCTYYNLCNCSSNFCCYNLNCSSADCSQPVQSY